MTQISVYTNPLLNVLATNLGVNPGQAAAKAKSIADSYATLNRAYGEQKAAVEITKAFRINAQVLNNVLIYVNDVEGSISREHTKPLSRETVQRLESESSIDGQLNDINRKVGSGLSTKPSDVYLKQERRLEVIGVHGYLGSDWGSYSPDSANIPGGQIARAVYRSANVADQYVDNTTTGVEQRVLPQRLTRRWYPKKVLSGFLALALVGNVAAQAYKQSIVDFLSGKNIGWRQGIATDYLANRLVGQQTDYSFKAPPSKQPTQVAAPAPAQSGASTPTVPGTAGQKFNLDKEVAIWAQALSTPTTVVQAPSTDPGQPSTAQAPGATAPTAPAKPATAATPSLDDVVKMLGELETKTTTNYTTLAQQIAELKADYGKLGNLPSQFADLGKRIDALYKRVEQAGKIVPVSAKTTEALTPTHLVPSTTPVTVYTAGQKAREYVAKFGDLLWNVVKGNYGLEDNDAIAKQVNVVVYANPHLPHLRTDNRAVVPLDVALRTNLDIVKIFPDKGLAAVAKGDENESKNIICGCNWNSTFICSYSGLRN